MSEKKHNETSLTIDEFLSMDKSDITKWVNASDKADIISFLTLMVGIRAFSWEDRMLLQMVDKSPFTFWASDKSYKVRLWEGKSSTVYARDMLGREFYEFISRYERSNAMADSIKIINAKDTELAQLLEDFKNYYTEDIVGNRASIGIVTNTIQLIDDTTGEAFYAEIGVPIDLQKALKEFNERQKEFETQIRGFKDYCDELLLEANQAEKEVKKQINDKKRLEIGRRHKLRELCSSEFGVIKKEIKTAKEEAAVDFERFIRDAEESIQLVKDKMNEVIENETLKIEYSTVPDTEQKRTELRDKIVRRREYYEILFSTLLIDVKALDPSDSVSEEYNRRIARIREKKNLYLQQFAEYIQWLAQTPAILLDSLEQRYDEFDIEIENYVAKERYGNYQ